MKNPYISLIGKFHSLLSTSSVPLAPHSVRLVAVDSIRSIQNHPVVCTATYKCVLLLICVFDSDDPYTIQPQSIYYTLLERLSCTLRISLTCSLAKWEQSPGHTNKRCTSKATDFIGSPEPMCQLGNKDEQIEQIE